ncbi:MAG: phosphotransferase [Cohaesibacteraceae bacterium]|nr:phosphotransferase [Cohaesibacteraceae bacterium]
MSLPWTPRPPANTGFTAKSSRYIAASRKANALISSILDRDLTGLEIMEGSGSDDQMHTGFYRHFDKTTGTGDFLKLISNDEYSSQKRAAHLTDWLADNEVATIKTDQIVCHGSYTLCISAFVSLRPPHLEVSDMECLGAALAKLHKTLPDYPDIEQIKSGGIARLNMLATRLDDVLDAPTNYPADASAIPQLASMLDQPFKPATRSNAVHGDLNIGNLAFDIESGSFIFLDFEDALVSWLPQETDLAMMLQRTVLQQNGSIADKITCGKALFAAYRSADGPAEIKTAEDLGNYLAWIILRSMTVLCEMHIRGEKVTISEWKKFNQLGTDLQNHTPVLEAICNA